MRSKAFILFIFSLCIFGIKTDAAQSQTKTIHQFASKEAKFTVSFPLAFTQKQTPTELGKIYELTTIKDDLFYEVRFGIEQSPLPKSKHQEFITRLKALYLTKGKQESQKDMSTDQYQASEIRFLTESSGVKTFNTLQIIVTDTVWYTLRVFSHNTPPSETEQKSFFESFRRI